MATDRIDLQITTPERLTLAETVDEVVLPGADGYLGVLPGHAPLLTGLAAGEIAYRIGREERYLAVSGGFAEVLGNRVSILAETCEFAEEIDLDRAERSRKRAEKQIGSHESEHEFRDAATRLRRATARIRVRGRIP